MPPKELPAPSSEEAQTPKKRSKFKFFMLIGSLLLLLGAGGGGGYWWLFMRPDAPGLAGIMGMFKSEPAVPEPGQGNASGAAASASSASSGAPQSSAEGEGESPRRAQAVLRPVPLPEITVNLADPPGDRYLKIAMEVEVSAQDAERELQNQTARVRDAIILLLSSKTVRDLTSAEGKVLLKNEVASRLNQILGAPRIVRVFFTNFVIQ